MKKGFLAVVASALIGFVLVGDVQAAYGYNLFGYTLNGGVGSYGNAKRYYFVDSSASGSSSVIDTGMSEWVNSTARTGVTTSVSYRSTTTQSSSVMDWYAGNYYDASQGVIAETEFWIYSTKVAPTAQNWGWNKEKINSVTYSPLSDWDERGSVAHEIGHAFGLAHSNSNPYAIMCQLSNGRQVQSATADDLNGVNALYH
ncbi:matrixin family metalloprotease [Tumebacillus permanentifrigoris]|uniref:Matrixin n=1 Tax=Tumebacillus permanentifrigoris TaxID=378543 RepID=A0A316DCM1_9BACL|nr:matrixin family metalloprotease [Tumebacillus permanentifrigoris]PWK14943.1 matrixin [Tumebacillus permanentifrigoris]